MVTALSPIILLAAITLGPAVLGLVIYLVSRAGRATWRLTLALTALGAMVPAAGLPFLGQYVAAGDPITLQPFGHGDGFGAWVAPVYRLDTFALFAAVGVALLIAPILLWVAFADNPRTSVLDGDQELPAASLVEIAEQESGDLTVTHQSIEDSDTSEDSGGPNASTRGLRSADASQTLVRAVSLVLGLETAALTLAFADSIVLVGIAWIILAVFAWIQGELSSEPDTVDRVGFVAMLLGPLLWLAFMLLPATAAQSTRLLDLTGRTAISPVQCILLAVAVALGGGAYPFSAWVHRRSALATPVGLAAIVLALLPAALYVAARTYSVAIDAGNRWPLFGTAPRATAGPAPITAGIAFAVLGAATVLICGVLALSRRDGRMLIALLASAQVGWAMVGLGSGQPAAVLGVTLLLPVAVLGLGAMLTALVAGGALTSDDEPDANGPCPVHEPPRPLALASWTIGGLTLIGAPLLAGFAPRHLMSMGSLQTSGLLLPLSSLCWVGDVLFALAFVRATAPSLAGTSSGALARSEPRDLVTTILGVLTLGIGIVPALLIGQVGTVAADALVAPRGLAGLVALSAAGYTAGMAQWLPGIAWLSAIIIGVVLLAVHPPSGRRLAPAVHESNGAHSEAQRGDVSRQSPPLSEPAQMWGDLRGAFNSPFTVPGRQWLVAGLDTEDEQDADQAAGDANSAASTTGEPVAATVEEKVHGPE